MTDLTLATLPALDELTHVQLDSYANQLGLLEPEWPTTGTKADKYKVLVDNLAATNPADGPDPVPSSLPNQAEPGIRRTDKFVLSVDEFGIAQISTVGWIGEAQLSIPAADLDALRALLS